MIIILNYLFNYDYDVAFQYNTKKHYKKNNENCQYFLKTLLFNENQQQLNLRENHIIKMRPPLKEYIKSIPNKTITSITVNELLSPIYQVTIYADIFICLEALTVFQKN